MNKPVKKERKPLSARVLNAFIGILLLIAVSAFTWMLGQIRDYSSRERYSSIAYHAQQGDYASMIWDCCDTAYNVEPFRTENESAYQVALYADAAFQHLYFDAAGEEDMAALHAGRMAQARSRSGEMQPLTDEIDAILSRIPLNP